VYSYLAKEFDGSFYVDRYNEINSFWELGELLILNSDALVLKGYKFLSLKGNFCKIPLMLGGSKLVILDLTSNFLTTLDKETFINTENAA